MSALALRSALAIKIDAQNTAQRSLIKDVPTMIECLCLLLDNSNIVESSKTREMLNNFGEGYLKYGRLTDPMLVTLKDVILQHAAKIVAVRNDARSSSTSHASSSVSDTDSDLTQSQADDDDDPFA